MNPLEPVRVAVHSAVKQIAQSFSSIQSVTVVGSFETASTLDVVGDIDVVIIVDELRSAEFMNIIDRFNRITGKKVGLPEYQVRVNPTFGPLKFTQQNTLVFHVMVYDLAGHRDHVAKSPFTCLDWERNDAIVGIPLRKIYSAACVQPIDITTSRRGIESYITDLAAGNLTYREYDLSGPVPRQITRKLLLDARHTAEFAYHTLRNLFRNALKVLAGSSHTPEGTALIKAINSQIAIDVDDERFFLALYRWKREGALLPEKIVEKTLAIIQRFSIGFQSKVAASPRVLFLRHGRTAVNNGSFLGSRRNPAILPPELTPPEEQKYLQDVRDTVSSMKRIYTSPLIRARETGQQFRSGAEVVIDSRLREIDYGAAEGLTFDELGQRFPTLTTAWSRAEDPPFPEGESQKDVAARLASFIADEIVDSRESVCVVTHNVVLRCLLGRAFDAPLHQWHRLQPHHLEPLLFRSIGGVLVPELTTGQRTRFRDQLFPDTAGMESHKN